MSKKDYRKEAKAAVNARIEAVKEALKSKKNWKVRIFQKYPEYDTASGGEHLRNFLALRASSDIILLERLEDMVKDWPDETEEDNLLTQTKTKKK